MTTFTRAQIVRLDEILVERFDAELARGASRAGRHLSCRLGCTDCCLGPFDITSLDAARLRRGLEALDPATAAAVRERAREQWRTMAASFPGDGTTGALDEDDGARERFCARHASLPCPALDPASGACVLYAYRPLSCRSFGLPVRCEEGLLPPCRLNFVVATAEEIEGAAIDPDGEGLEDALLDAVGEADTLVVAALALQGRTRRPTR